MNARGTSAHVAVILAAGGSRRLGRPKQLLTRDGEPILRRVARLAIETAPLRTLVVLGAHRDAIAPVLDGLDCVIVVNADWAAGLSTSLACADAALRGHAGPVLLSACDQPGVRGEDFAALLRGAQAAHAGVAATAHADGGPGIPVVVPVTMLAPGADLDGDRGLGARLRRLRPGSWHRLETPALHVDLDTDDDVRRAVECGWLDAEMMA